MWENTQKRFMKVAKQSISRYKRSSLTSDVSTIKKAIGSYCKGYKIHDAMLNDLDIFMDDEENKQIPYPYPLKKQHLKNIRGKNYWHDSLYNKFLKTNMHVTLDNKRKVPIYLK